MIPEHKELLDRILEIATDHLEFEPEELSPETPFAEICDKLDIEELFMAFEEEFEIEISELDAEEIGCVNDAVEVIRRILWVNENSAKMKKELGWD